MRYEGDTAGGSVGRERGENMGGRESGGRQWVGNGARSGRGGEYEGEGEEREGGRGQAPAEEGGRSSRCVLLRFSLFAL